MSSLPASPVPVPLAPAQLRQANIHPETGLATDFLNPFNEYVMLAEMVQAGAMTPDCLLDWTPVDYCAHFAASGFAHAATIIDAYHALDDARRADFDSAVADLTLLILAHQAGPAADAMALAEIRDARDRVAGMISGAGPDCRNGMDESALAAQADIDALFD